MGFFLFLCGIAMLLFMMADDRAKEDQHKREQFLRDNNIDTHTGISGFTGRFKDDE